MEEKRDIGCVPTRFQPLAVPSSAPPRVASSALWPTREQDDQPSTFSVFPPRLRARCERVRAKTPDSGAEGSASFDQDFSFLSCLNQSFTTQAGPGLHLREPYPEGKDANFSHSKLHMLLATDQDSEEGLEALKIAGPKRARRRCGVEAGEPGDILSGRNTSASTERFRSELRRRSSQPTPHQEDKQITRLEERTAGNTRDVHSGKKPDGNEGSSIQESRAGTPSRRSCKNTDSPQVLSGRQEQERETQEETFLLGKPTLRAGQSRRVENRREAPVTNRETRPAFFLLAAGAWISAHSRGAPTPAPGGRTPNFAAAPFAVPLVLPAITSLVPRPAHPGYAGPLAFAALDFDSLPVAGLVSESAAARLQDVDRSLPCRLWGRCLRERFSPGGSPHRLPLLPPFCGVPVVRPHSRFFPRPILPLPELRPLQRRVSTPHLCTCRAPLRPFWTTCRTPFPLPFSRIPLAPISLVFFSIRGQICRHCVEPQAAQASVSTGPVTVLVSCCMPPRQGHSTDRPTLLARDPVPASVGLPDPERRIRGVSASRATPTSSSAFANSWRSHSSSLFGPPASRALPRVRETRDPLSPSGSPPLFATEEIQTFTAARPESFGAARAVPFPSPRAPPGVALNPPFPNRPFPDRPLPEPPATPLPSGAQPSRPCSFAAPGVGAGSFPPFLVKTQPFPGDRGASPCVRPGDWGAAPVDSVAFWGARGPQPAWGVPPFWPRAPGGQAPSLRFGHAGPEHGGVARLRAEAAQRDSALQDVRGITWTGGSASGGPLPPPPVYPGGAQPSWTFPSKPGGVSAELPPLRASLGIPLGDGHVVPETAFPPSVCTTLDWQNEASLRVNGTEGSVTNLGLVASSATCVRGGYLAPHFRLWYLAFERFLCLSDPSRARRTLGKTALWGHLGLKETLQPGVSAQVEPSTTRQLQPEARETSLQDAEPQRKSDAQTLQNEKEREVLSREDESLDSQGTSCRGEKLQRRVRDSQAGWGGESQEPGTPRQAAGEALSERAALRRGRSETRRRRPAREGPGGNARRRRAARGQDCRGELKERVEDSSESEGVPRRFFGPGLPGNLSPRPPQPASSPEPPPLLSLPSPLCASGRSKKDKRRLSSDSETSHSDSWVPCVVDGLGERRISFRAPEAHRVAFDLCGRLGNGMMQVAQNDRLSTPASRVHSPPASARLSSYGGGGAVAPIRDFSSCPAPHPVAAPQPLREIRPQAQRPPVSLRAQEATRARLSAAQSGLVPERVRGNLATGVEPGRDLHGRALTGPQPYATSIPFYHPVSQASAYDPKNDTRAYYATLQRVGASPASLSNLQGATLCPDASLWRAGPDRGGVEVCGPRPGFRGAFPQHTLPVPQASTLASASASRGVPVPSPRRSSFTLSQSRGGPLGPGGGDEVPTQTPRDSSRSSAAPDHVSFPLSGPPLRGMSSVSYAAVPNGRGVVCQAMSPGLGGDENLGTEGPSSGVVERLPPPGPGRRRPASTGPTLDLRCGSGRHGAVVPGLWVRGRTTRQSGRRPDQRGADSGARPRDTRPENGSRAQAPSEEGGNEREQEELEQDESDRLEGDGEGGQAMTGGRSGEKKGRWCNEHPTEVPRATQRRAGDVKRDVEADGAEESSEKTHGPRLKGRSGSSAAGPALKRHRVASEAVEKTPEANNGGTRHRDVPVIVDDSDRSCRQEARQQRAGVPSPPGRGESAVQLGRGRNSRPIRVSGLVELVEPESAGWGGGDGGGRKRDEDPKRGEHEGLTQRPRRHGEAGKGTLEDQIEHTGFLSSSPTGAGGLEATLPGFVLGGAGRRPRGTSSDGPYIGAVGVSSATLDGRRYGGVECGEGTPSAGDSGPRGGARGGPKGGPMSLVAFSFLAPQQGMSEHFWKQSFEVIDHWRAADEDAEEEKIFTFASSVSVGPLGDCGGGAVCSASPGGLWGTGRASSWGTKEEASPADASRFPVSSPVSGCGGCSSSTLAHCGTPGTPAGVTSDRNGLSASPETGRPGVSSPRAVPVSAAGAESLRPAFGATVGALDDEEKGVTLLSPPTGGTVGPGPSCGPKPLAAGVQAGGARLVCLPSLCHPARGGPVSTQQMMANSLSLLPAFSPSALQACGFSMPGMGPAGVGAFSFARPGQGVNNGTQMITVSLFPKEWLGRNGRLCRRSGMLKGCLRALRDVNLLEEDSTLYVEAPLLLTRPSPNGGDGRLLIPRHTITLRIDHPFPAFISCSRPSNGDHRACLQNRIPGCVCPSCSAYVAPPVFDSAQNSCASSLSTASTSTHGSSSSSARRNPRAGVKARAREGGPDGRANAGETAGEEKGRNDASGRRASFPDAPQLGDGSSLLPSQGQEEGNRSGAEREETAEADDREGGPRDSPGGLATSNPREPRAELMRSGSGGNPTSSFNAAASFGVLSGVLSDALAAVASASPLPSRGASAGFRPAASFRTWQSSPLTGRGTTPPASGASDRRTLGSKVENDVSSSRARAGDRAYVGRGRTGEPPGGPVAGHRDRTLEATDSSSGSTPSSYCGSSRTTSATSVSCAGGSQCTGCTSNSEATLASCSGGSALIQGPFQHHILVRSKPAYLLLWRYGERGTSQDPKRKWYVVTPMFVRTKWFGRCFEFYSRFQQGQLEKHKLLVVDALNRVSPKRDAIIQAWCLAGCLEATLKELGVDYQVREVTEGPWQGFPEPTLTDEDQVIEGTLQLVTDPIDELETSYSSLLSEISAGVGALNSAPSGFSSSFLSRQHSEALQSKTNDAGCPPAPLPEGGVYGRNVVSSSLSPLGVLSSPLASSLGAGRVQGRLGISSGACYGRVNGGPTAGGVQRSGRTLPEGSTPEDEAGEQGRRERGSEPQDCLDSRGAKRRREEDPRGDGLGQVREREAKEGRDQLEEKERTLHTRLLASGGCAPLDSAQRSQPLHTQRTVVRE
ncbi:hypothetical protein TGVAND_223080 [Toxoplasma gondii VAND]|uniref:Uncharacterized protein n=1 Tax=Toxoplasma gondii VAND TaxID=933077 RepID=A0A086PSW5_TOXGO|nr:hypothetical protein TGVAND_223080 [Toxoplasma gondii VAND]